MLIIITFANKHKQYLFIYVNESIFQLTKEISFMHKRMK